MGVPMVSTFGGLASIDPKVNFCKNIAETLHIFHLCFLRLCFLRLNAAKMTNSHTDLQNVQPATGIEPIVFSSPGRCSNHWAIRSWYARQIFIQLNHITSSRWIDKTVNLILQFDDRWIWWLQSWCDLDGWKSAWHIMTW
jgi:hypothetical protein